MPAVSSSDYGWELRDGDAAKPPTITCAGPETVQLAGKKLKLTKFVLAGPKEGSQIAWLDEKGKLIAFKRGTDLAKMLVE